MFKPISDSRGLTIRSVVLTFTLLFPLAYAAAQGQNQASPSGDKPDSQSANQPLPNLDTAIREALDKNPDILVAKAKVQEAEAVLYQTQLNVAQQVLSLRAKAENDLHRASEARKKADAKSISTEELRDALEATQSSRAQFDYALGRALYEWTLKGRELNRPIAGAEGARSVRSAPHGPEADAIQKALSRKASLDLKQVPFKDMVNKLADLSGVNFVVDTSGLDTCGISVDQPTDLLIKDASLCAMLQALDDSMPDLRFVVRDYGILVTTVHSRAAEEGCEVGDFVRSDVNAQPKQ
jgi:hypothetical protein